MEFPDFHHLRPDGPPLHQANHHRRRRGFLAVDAPAGDMPSGEDTRLYNYGVPVIERSKLSFPAPREQEVRRPEPDGRHCEKYEDSPGMRGQLFFQFHSLFLITILQCNHSCRCVCLFFFFRALEKNHPACSRAPRESLSRSI